MGHRDRGERWAGTMELRRRDGSTFIAEITRTPVLDDEGRLVALIGTSSDVSAREEATRELEQAHRTADGGPDPPRHPPGGGAGRVRVRRS